MLNNFLTFIFYRSSPSPTFPAAVDSVKTAAAAAAETDDSDEQGSVDSQNSDSSSDERNETGTAINPPSPISFLVPVTVPIKLQLYGNSYWD